MHCLLVARAIGCCRMAAPCRGDEGVLESGSRNHDGFTFTTCTQGQFLAGWSGVINTDHWKDNWFVKYRSDE
jgi:hypothetical protein